MSYACTDLSEKPIEVEQSCTFFNSPREIRDLIYGFVFEGGKSEEGALSPLGSCRQFYIEARGTAWSAVTFRFDWSKISHKYFDGDWMPPRSAEETESSFQECLDREREEAGLFPNGADAVLATRSPADFTVRSIATRAGLSPQQIGAIRRIHVAPYVVYPRVFSSYDNLWVLQHFLQSLQETLDTPKFNQLDRLDIRMLYAGFSPKRPAFSEALTSLTSGLWAHKITKRIVVSFPYSREQSKAVSPVWTKVEKDRISFASQIFRATYEKKNLNALQCRSATYEGNMRWEWKYYCTDQEHAGLCPVRYIEITEAGELPSEDLEEEYRLDMQLRAPDAPFPPLVISSRPEVLVGDSHT